MSDLPSSTEFRQKLRDIEQLATVPYTMERLKEVAADPNASARTLGRVIAEDQSLASKVLKVANSAYYGRIGGVVNIADAVVILGFDEVERLAISMSVIDAFQGDDRPDERRMRFWLHCFHTAGIAELIDRQKGRGRHGVFTAGLLHDIGRLVVDQYFPSVFERVRTVEERTGRPAVEVEDELLGYTHAHIGFWLAERWRFPPILSEAIRFHHQPGHALGAGRPAAMVHVADALAHQMDDGPEAQPREMQASALAVLDLMPSEARGYVPRLRTILEAGDEMVIELMGFIG